MPQANEPLYCSEQIKIPPELPDILKQFTKAAIKTQPKDVLAWSAAYFRAMANHEVPPVKERLELPIATQNTDSGLTHGLLKILNNQLGPKLRVPISLIEQKWTELSLPIDQFHDLVRIGNFTGTIEWVKFFALACSSLGENITDAMKMVCEILTASPEGSAAAIPFKQFSNLYTYLAQIDGEISDEHVTQVINYLQTQSDKQDNFVEPRNFLSDNCPSLSG